MLTELKKLTDTMDFNGDAWFNDIEFKARTNKPCYVPANAETMEDVFSYIDLYKLVSEWALDNPNYLNEHETTVEAIVLRMYEDIVWLFPSTWLANLETYD